MTTKRANEADAYRCDVAETSTTSAPTDGVVASHAVKTPESHRTRTRCHLRAKKTIASGVLSLRLIVWGRQSRAEDASGDEQADDIWFPLFDTGLISTSDTTYRDAWLIEGAQDYEDLVTEVRVNGGTTPSLSTWLAFAGADPN